MSKPPLSVIVHSTVTIARIIPHPWKKGQTRNVYEFPVTRKIIIEADTDVPESEILAMAKRCNDNEMGIKIIRRQKWKHVA